MKVINTEDGEIKGNRNFLKRDTRRYSNLDHLLASIVDRKMEALGEFLKLSWDRENLQQAFRCATTIGNSDARALIANHPDFKSTKS